MNQHIDVSIIVLNFNTKDLTLSCLRSIKKSKKPTDKWEIVLVDNASTDGSREAIKKEFPHETTLFLDKNVGFAAGNNAGIRIAKGRNILLLNSDTQISKEAVAECLSFMDQHPDAGVVTCRLELLNGHLDPACHRGFPTPWASLTYFAKLEKTFPQSRLFGLYHQGYKDLNTTHEIDSPSGAFYFIRREVIDQVGLLDEDFFMYGEDLDWSYRIKKAGWKIFFNPSATVLHLKKQSGRENENIEIRDTTKIYFYNTMKLFYKKHYKHTYSPLTYGLVLLGIKILSLI